MEKINEMPIRLKIVSTGGVSYTNKMGYLCGYDWVWYHQGGIANILSLARVKEKIRVTFDSSKDNMFHIHFGGDKIRSYRESNKGLYYNDFREQEGDVFVNTVKHNKTKHSQQAYTCALNARILQNKLTGPSYGHFEKLLKTRNFQIVP